MERNYSDAWNWNIGNFCDILHDVSRTKGSIQTRELSQRPNGRGLVGSVVLYN